MSDVLRADQTQPAGANGHIVDCISYFAALSSTIPNLPYRTIEQVIDRLHAARQEGHTVFLFGNGGSAALASHFACDLAKGTAGQQLTRRRFRVVALTDNIPLMTAWANDTNYENIFAEQLYNLIQPGDIAFAISGSGNSPNVLRALEVARENGAFTMGLSGSGGGRMKALCELCVVVPSDNMQVIEDLHLSTAHSIFTALRYRLGQREIAAAAGR